MTMSILLLFFRCYGFLCVTTDSKKEKADDIARDAHVFGKFVILSGFELVFSTPSAYPNGTNNYCPHGMSEPPTTISCT